MGADGYWLAVSTHSRLKAAGAEAGKEAPPDGFNTQPPEGGCMTCQDKIMRLIVSTHSRLKAAGKLLFLLVIINRFQHTAA